MRRGKRRGGSSQHGRPSQSSAREERGRDWAYTLRRRWAWCLGVSLSSYTVCSTVQSDRVQVRGRVRVATRLGKKPWISVRHHPYALCALQSPTRAHIAQTGLDHGPAIRLVRPVLPPILAGLLPAPPPRAAPRTRADRLSSTACPSASSRKLSTRVRPPRTG